MFGFIKYDRKFFVNLGLGEDVKIIGCLIDIKYVVAVLLGLLGNFIVFIWFK